MKPNDILAEIKAAQDANPKFQALKAAIEKRKAELKAKQSEEQ